MVLIPYAPRILYAQVLKEVVWGPCVVAGIITGLASIASWTTFAVAGGVGDASVANTLGYTTLWFGTLSFLLLGAAVFISAVWIVDENGRKRASPGGQRWS